MKSISKKAWRLGKIISVDEQTMGFQGRHPSKLRITYKNEGDGFQCNTLCDNGYTFSFYFRHEPPPVKYTALGLSPLHARVMYLFDACEDEFHICGVDNLYMSAKFCKDAYNHNKKICLHGVTRKGGRGLPQSVVQEEVTNPKAQETVRGTVRAAELLRDPYCPSLVAVSVYDTKPVHFLTMATERIFWEEKSRDVFDKATNQMTKMKFLRLNVNDDYNFGMGGADIADQIRGSYRFDHWLRNFKWWHSIFWWGMQVLMVNAYKCYCEYIKSLSETPMNHYEFQKMIAHVWMDKDYYTKSTRHTQDGDSTSTLSTFSIRTTTSSRRSRSRISASALNPMTGSLKCRLDRSLPHWPSAPSKDEVKKFTCQVHYWAAGIRKYKNVQCCKECNVSLCTEGCFELFHTCWDITSEKRRLIGSMSLEDDIDTD